MSSLDDDDPHFQFSQENVERLKTKYSTEMKDDATNPIKICMKLVFQAAIERDPAKRIALSLELSQFLTRPDGVINLFLALIDFDTSSQMVTTHNQRFLAVAKIITCLPKLNVPYHDYCVNILRQLRPLLIHPNTLYSSLAAIIIKALIESPHAGKQNGGNSSIAVVVVGPILGRLTKVDDDKFRVSHAILAIHNLIQNHLPTRLFVEHFSSLFFCLATLYDTPSRLKTYLKSSLIEIINNLRAGPACCLLDKTLFYDSKTHNTYEVVADDDEITVEVAAHTDPDPTVMDELVIEILEGCDNHPLIVEYFFYFQSKMWTSCDRETAQRCASLVGPLLSQTIEEKPENKLDVLASIMTDSSNAVELINRTLMHYLNFLRVPHDEQTMEAQDLAETSISSCLDILRVLFTTTTTTDPKALTVIHGKTSPTLREIKTILLDGQRSSKKLVLSLETLLKDLTDESTELCSSRLNESLSQKEHQLILRDLNDKEVPVRAHALVRLRQMLVANDRLTIDMIPRLYPMVESPLADQEPYVFLASIKVIEEMSLHRTDEILPKLIALYARADLDTQHRINVGEVLARLTRQMNETTPHYARQMWEALLGGTADPEELIRMSSLTNIGFICKNLGHSLHKYIIDVFTILRAIPESETIQVKCAAVDLLRTTLMGLDRHNVETIQQDLKSIRGILAKLTRATLDENLDLQVELALGEIKRLVNDIMAVPSGRLSGGRLVKNIKVLSLD